MDANGSLEEGQLGRQAGFRLSLSSGANMTLTGQRSIAGIIRPLKSPSQRQYNYFQSAATEAIALVPKAPFVAVKGQLEGEEEKWGSANMKNYAKLQQQPHEHRWGHPLGLPSAKPLQAAPIQAMTLMVRQADAELRITFIGFMIPRLARASRICQEKPSRLSSARRPSLKCLLDFLSVACSIRMRGDYCSTLNPEDLRFRAGAADHSPGRHREPCRQSHLNGADQRAGGV